MVTVYNLKYREYSVHEIYRKFTVDIPIGYELVDFRPPRQGDKYISNRNIAKVLSVNEFWRLSDEPRIIVKQIPTNKGTPMNIPKKDFTKTWTIKEIYGVEDPVIPDGYEVKDFRFVEYGETFLDLFRKAAVSILAFESQTPKLILHKQKKLYAKIPITDLKKLASCNRVKFKTVDNYDFEADLPEDVEIIEE